MVDLSSVLEERLPVAYLSLLRAAADVAGRQGVGLYLVGGTVRDLLLGVEPGDPDLAAVGAGDPFAVALAEHLGGELVAVSQFGTWKVRVGASHLDIVTARRESYTHPGALPSVEPGSIDDDLARRDFSINAMAVSLDRTTWGHLLDPFDGRGDLGLRLIRVLHPASFVDDATRILRAVRYGQRLGFRLEPDTGRALSAHLRYLETVSGDRVRREIEHIFREARVGAILTLSQDLGVLSTIYPALSVDDRSLGVLGDIDPRPSGERDLLLMALLTYPLSPTGRAGLTSRLNLGSEWARVVEDTGAARDVLVDIKSPTGRPSHAYRLLRGLHPASVGACALMAEDALVKRYLERYLTQWRHARTLLNGDDLLALGVPRGPMVGELLEELLAARLDGLVVTRKGEEDLVRRALVRRGV